MRERETSTKTRSWAPFRWKRKAPRSKSEEPLCSASGIVKLKSSLSKVAFSRNRLLRGGLQDLVEDERLGAVPVETESAVVEERGTPLLCERDLVAEVVAAESRLLEEPTPP